MNRVKKTTAILSVLLMLGTVIYQVGAAEGTSEYFNDVVIASADEMVSVDEVVDETLHEEEVDSSDEEQANGPEDLGNPQEDGFWLDYDVLEYPLEVDGAFQGFAPMFAPLPTLNVTAFCYYNPHVQLSPNILTDVEWVTEPPDAFSVSFPAAIIPPVPEGWSFQGVYIRYTLLGEPISLRPMYPVGEMMRYSFSVEFREYFSFYLNPAFVVFWRPDHPSILKEAEPIDPATLPVFVGDVVEYTITITNPAVNPLPLLFTTLPPWRLTSFDDFRVVDELPDELALIESSVTVTGGTGFVDNSCAVDNVIDVTFNLPGSNEPGHPVVITFRAVVTHEALGVDEIVNTADLYHPNYSDPIDYDRERLPVINPSLEKDAIFVNDEVVTEETRVSDGDLITYRIRVNNPSERTLEDFLVVDELPAGLSLVGVQQVIPATALEENQSTGNTVRVVLNLPPGDTDVIFIARVDDVTLATDGIFVNIATLYGPPPQEGGQRPPIDDDREDVPARGPGISLEKSVHPPTVNPGGTVSYTLVVENTGGAVLTNVVVTDDLPDQLNLPRNLVITPEGVGEGSFEGQLLTVTIPHLGVGEQVIITFDATVAPGVAPDTIIDNVAEVTTDQNVGDEDDASVTVKRPEDPPPQYRPPGISIEKSVSSETVQPGEILTYTLVVRNLGDTVLTGVVVTDNLPSQLTNPRHLVITPPWMGSGSFTGQLLTVNIPQLGIDEVVTITFQVTVAQNVPNGTVIRNVSNVVTEQGPSDEDDATTTVTHQPPGQTPVTGDYGILTSILFLFVVASTTFVMMSLIKGEKKRLRKK